MKWLFNDKEASLQPQPPSRSPFLFPCLYWNLVTISLHSFLVEVDIYTSLHIMGPWWKVAFSWFVAANSNCFASMTSIKLWLLWGLCHLCGISDHPCGFGLPAPPAIGSWLTIPSPVIVAGDGVWTQTTHTQNPASTLSDYMNQLLTSCVLP